MKLATLRTSDGPRAVGVDDGGKRRFVDLAAVDGSLPRSVRELLAAEDGLARADAAFTKGVERGTFVEGTLLAPIPDPGKVICIGLNYRDHANETGARIPEEPIVFSKFPQCVIGPEEPVVIPAACKTVDYEAELVAVVGRRTRRVSRENALAAIAGYTIGNDVSARDWQKGRPGNQWLLGKAPDTFAPCGPWLVTADEVANPHDLAIRLRLNGETLQDGHTSELIFGIDAIVAHIAQLITLEPGDLIYTGTPAGVGAARTPPVWIGDGDRMEVQIEGLGVLVNPVLCE